MNYSPPAYLSPLLRLLRSPSSASSLDDADWDRVLRMARSARLHGVLAHRLKDVDARRLPPGARAQLESARAEALHVRQMLLYELGQVAQALARLDVEVMLLKGAAYVVQDLECANGRMPADLDVMVRRDQLERVEARLLDAGWHGTDLEDYDVAYYRRWAHQIPPMRAPGHVMEVDLHHAVLPPLGRLRIDTTALWDASVGVNRDGLRVLAREDQVLHAVVHLFVDSDCTNRLRDLVDIGALLTQFQKEDEHFIDRLQRRADALGAAPSLDHAAAFLDRWLGVSLLGAPCAEATAGARAARALMARRLAPPDPDGMPSRLDPAHAMLLGQSLWLRLPPRLGVLHAVKKGGRRIGLR
ncbi:MAG: nucleotidyltransferase domain-containing protein [Burkholderiaceae bacterium]